MKVLRRREYILKQLLSPHATWYFQIKDISQRDKYQNFNADREFSLYPIIVSVGMLSVLPVFVGLIVRSTSTVDYVFSVLVVISEVIVAILGFISAYIHYQMDKIKASAKNTTLVGVVDSHNLDDDFNDDHNNDDDETEYRASELVDKNDDEFEPIERGDSNVSNSNSNCNSCGKSSSENSYLGTHPGISHNAFVQQQLTLWTRFLTVLTRVYVIIFQILILSYVLRRSYGEICTGMTHDESKNGHINEGNPYQILLNYFYCGNITEHYLTLDCIYMLAMAPIAIATIFPSLDVVYLWMQMISSMIVFIVVSISKEHIPSIMFLICWSISDIFIIGQMQLDKIHRFYLHLKLIDLLETHKKNAEAFHVSEMRYLIANVAHDLKTPLMSFTSAISLMSQSIDENERIQEVANITTETSACLKRPHPHGSFLTNMKELVASLNDTNTFMLMTINRCIDYAKAAKGIKLTPKLETIDLWEALQMPVNCMKNVQDRVSVELLELPKEISCRYIITDRQWLQENVLCLLSNAVKYTNRGKVTITLSYFEKHVKSNKKRPSGSSMFASMNSMSSAALNQEAPKESILPDQMSGKSGTCWMASTSIGSDEHNKSIRITTKPYLLIEIEDNGIGVSPTNMTQLFKPFKQAQRLAGGTGLGLYSLAKRVEGLQGEYGVRGRNDDEKGSVFWFSIPYRPDESMMNEVADNDSARSTSNLEEHTDLQSPSASLPTNSQPKSDPLKLNILIVDDAPTIVKMTSMMLRKLGHTVTTAENGEVAVGTVDKYWQEESKCFDVILMDLQMPVMDGLEATRRIRLLEKTQASSNYPSFPKQLIIGVSANSDHETEEHALKSGMDGFIAKPFTAALFVEMLTKYRFDRQ